MEGASKLSLSSISSEELWSRSGRLAAGSEVNISWQAFFSGLNHELALSVGGQKSHEISFVSNSRGRNYNFSLKCREIVQRSSGPSISNM